jgi:hypothetical protein
MALLSQFSFASLRCVIGAGLLLAGGFAAADTASTVVSRVPQPIIETARGGSCVADPSIMRRDHMKMLKHQRGDTMRGGIRTGKSSLKACIDCHASQSTNSVVAAETNFCQSCHSYAAVKIDCFECHNSKPQASKP